MANPVCLSPLKIYDDVAKQNHRKSYAYGEIHPLISRKHTVPPFQFVVPSGYNSLQKASIYSIDDNVITEQAKQFFNNTGLTISDVSGNIVVSYPGIFSDSATLVHEGYYYLSFELTNGNDTLTYYSEVFCCTSNTADYLEIEYWNESGNLFIKNGVVSFENDYHFYILLDTELGKPEYSFEEEVTKRLGYSFVESQVSKKTYKFTAVIPEYLCDAMRIIRMCDNKVIRNRNDEYEAITFDMSVEWQNQGDLASAVCEFETDNVVTNLGSFKI